MSILYKITTQDGKVSHLFGTIHKNDEAFVTLPLEVKKAFEQASDCVFEVDISMVDSIVWLVKNWFDDQANYLGQVCNDKDYCLSARKNYKKIYDESVKADPNSADPFDLAFAMQNIELVSPLFIAQAIMIGSEQIDLKKLVNGLDQQLESEAKLKKKKIAYLEPLERQYVALSGCHLNILEQIEVYRFIESEFAKGRKFPSLKDIEREYQQQNIQKLKDLLQVFPTAANVPGPVRRYFDGLSINRDLIMAEKMTPYLNSGNAFVAVGAAHLKGITDKLQTEGYTIEAVSLGKRHYSIHGTIGDGEKVAAFRKIYTALYMAQTSLFKKRGFVPIDDMVVSLRQIQDYTMANKDTRSSKAWKLAEKHYKNISSTNSELLKEVCQDGYAKSSSFFGLFRRTRTNLDNAQSVADASPETRTGTVRDILDGASI